MSKFTSRDRGKLEAAALFLFSLVELAMVEDTFSYGHTVKAATKEMTGCEGAIIHFIGTKFHIGKMALMEA